MIEDLPVLAPHQAEFVEKVQSSGTPLRLALSAPPGFGKTTAIAASLNAMADLHGKRKFLLVTPAALQASWKGILQRYGLDVQVVDAPAYRVLQMAAGPPSSTWDKLNGVVTSIDFLKRQDRLAEVLQAPWDLVVIDEAHLCTPLSQRGRVAMALWGASHIPRAVAASATIAPQADWILQTPNVTLIRWNPKNLLDWSGRPLLMEREIRTIPFEPSPEEKAFSQFLLEALEPLQSGSVTAKFVADVLMRRTGSSLYAIEESLRRYASVSVVGAKVDFDEPDEWSESEGEVREAGASDLLDSRVVATALKLLEDISQDSKFKACMDLLEVLKVSSRSVVIFTDFADTAEYLGGRFNERGLAAYVVTGKLTIDERYLTIKRASQDPGVLVLTSAVTEGTALQFTNQAVHYDLPLTAYGLLQRFGRIERIGSQFSRAYHYILSDNVTVTELAQLEAIVSEIERDVS